MEANNLIKNLNEVNPVSMAYLGDAVWELKVREVFFSQNLLTKDLNKNVFKYVNAKFQSDILLDFFQELPEEEKDVTRRARNARVNTIPKNSNVKEYKNSTAFEALIAFYYLNNEIGKIDAIINKYILKIKNETVE